MVLNRTERTVAIVLITARYAKNLGIDRNEQSANSACVASAEPQVTQRPNVRKQDAANAAARPTKAPRASRVLNTSALIAKARSSRKVTTETIALECNECGSTTHKSALSFACPEHKCTNCEGTLEPKGHNRNDCPRMQTTMCEECGETGHSANKCPICPCNACGLLSHKLQTSHLCPEHVCTLCNGEEEPKGHNNTICPRAECQTCKLFGHVAKDCAYANCLDVEDDWFNILFTKCESVSPNDPE